MNGLILFAALIFFLWAGRTILIPLLVAIFLWYLINAIGTYYRQIFPFYTDAEKQKHHIMSSIFDWISNILSAATLCVLMYLFTTQIRPMFSELTAALPELQHKTIVLANYLSDSIGLQFDTDMLPNMSKILTNIGSSAAGLVASTGMILVYILFLFVEQSTFNKKISALATNRRHEKKLRFILTSINDNMRKYLFIKTFISAITGFSAYLLLHALGLEFAGVWAFIIFVANYIPTIGSIVSCCLPILYALVSSPTLQLPVLTAIGLISIQVLFGNIIEPKLTGKTLNLSTLAILINLVFWGIIWGIAGMFFSVPLLVAVFVITAQFDSTRWIAILLSEDGKIPDKKDD